MFYLRMSHYSVHSMVKTAQTKHDAQLNIWPNIFDQFLRSVAFKQWFYSWLAVGSLYL